MKRSLILVCMALLLPACSHKKIDPVELFKLRAECANQARQFETDWRRDNGSDFDILRFRNHLNQASGHCYVHIYYGNPGLNMETVYDATEGVGRPPIALLIGGNAQPSKKDAEIAAEIGTYMEEANGAQSPDLVDR